MPLSLYRIPDLMSVAIEAVVDERENLRRRLGSSGGATGTKVEERRGPDPRR